MLKWIKKLLGKDNHTTSDDTVDGNEDEDEKIEQRLRDLGYK